MELYLKSLSAGDLELYFKWKILERIAKDDVKDDQLSDSVGENSSSSKDNFWV